MKLKQLGANQTEVQLSDHYETQIFFSYEQAVCVRTANGCFVTDKKYSQTTSGHINNWVANQSSIIQMVPQSEIDNFVNGASI